MTSLHDETVDLLQHCIRARCVNEGVPSSGNEERSARIIEEFLGTEGLDVETAEPLPGRRSVVARLEGTDPTAPSLCLLGHLDVVPASAEGWRHDPFGGELVDDEVWGRGAIDMLNLTCTMAASIRTLARSGARPKGTIIFAAVADEEAGGTYGAEYLLRNRADLVDADYVITESGGLSLLSEQHHGITVTVAEKGAAWRRLVVSGTPGHASMPFGSDNALVTAAEVVRRLAAHRSPAVVDEGWKAYVAALGLGSDLTARLADAGRIEDALGDIPDVAVASHAHACTHTTMAPTVVHAGGKTNVIPNSAVIEVDIRPLPGVGAAEVDAMLLDALGRDLAARVTIEPLCDVEATASPTDTPLYDVLGDVARAFYPEASLVPVTTPGGTDAFHFRRAGAVAYGFGLFSRTMTMGDFRSRFHARNERIDVESLRLTTEAWLALASRW